MLTLSTLILMNHANSAFKQSQQALPQPTPILQSLQHHQNLLCLQPFSNGFGVSSTSSYSTSNCSSLNSSSTTDTNSFSVRHSSESVLCANSNHKPVSMQTKSAKIVQSVPPSRINIPPIGLDGCVSYFSLCVLIASR